MATLPRLNEWGRVVTYRQIQLAKLKKNVEVHLGIGKMTADEILRYGADRIVLATGSHWCGDGRGANFGPIPARTMPCRMCSRPSRSLQVRP